MQDLIIANMRDYILNKSMLRIYIFNFQLITTSYRERFNNGNLLDNLNPVHSFCSNKPLQRGCPAQNNSSTASVALIHQGLLKCSDNVTFIIGWWGVEIWSYDIYCARCFTKCDRPRAVQ